MLPQDERHVEARRELDHMLAVPQWRHGFPTRKKPVQPKDRPAGAPSWWVDDEEASQTFLAQVAGRRA